MATRCVLLFQAGDQQAGWSEVYNLNAGSQSSALTAMLSLAAVRAKILSADNTIIGIRVTAPLTPPGPGFIRAQRTAYLYSTSIPGSAPPSIFGSSDLIWSAGMLRLNDNSLTIFRNQMYRGIPDNLWQSGGDAGARAFFQAWIPQWQGALTLAGAGINHKVRPAAVNLVQITSVEYIRLVTRHTGRSFATLRGRR